MIAGITKQLPAALQALMESELQVGNSIVWVDYGFPAPPAGFCIRLEKPVTTQAEFGEALVYREWPNWRGERGYTDSQGIFYVLDPPEPPEAEYPVMRYDEQGALIMPGEIAQPNAPAASEAMRRFRDSMTMSYEKWHDGIGYDLSALAEMSGAARGEAEALLLSQGISDWRDVEALAMLDSDAARSALREAMCLGNIEIRLAVARLAPSLLGETQLAACIVDALKAAVFYRGLTEAIELAARFHPPEVIAALWGCLEQRSGEVAVHLAALLFYVHGRSETIFDLKHRPLFMTFHTEDAAARQAAIAELRRRMDRE
jgi:hypothetical protein